MRAALLGVGAALAATWYARMPGAGPTVARAAPASPDANPSSSPGRAWAGVGAFEGIIETRDMFRSPLVAGQPQRAAQDPGPDRDALLNQIEAEAVKHLKVRAVMMGSDRVALINGRAHHEGDVIADFRVIGIASDHVVFEKTGIQITLGLK